MKYRIELGMKNMEKGGENTHSGQISKGVPVHVQGCTSTCTGVYRYTPSEAKVYRYTLGVYWYTLFCFPNFDQL